MKKTALILVAVLGAAVAAAHQGEISAEEWYEKSHTENVVPVPLVHAAAHGDLAEIKRLLDGGADPNAVANTVAYTALLAASINGHAAAVKALLDGGADPNVERGGKTPLFFAVNWGRLEIVQILLGGGADPNVRYEHDELGGWMPMQTAVSRKETEIIKALLAAGADPTLADNNGGTALMDACLWDMLNLASGDDGVELGEIIVGGSEVGWVRYVWACAEGMAYGAAGMLKDELENGGG